MQLAQHWQILYHPHATKPYKCATRGLSTSECSYSARRQINYPGRCQATVAMQTFGWVTKWVSVLC